MPKQGPLKRFKVIYQTRLNDDHEYKKIIYASTTKTAWIKFNAYCESSNIVLQDALIELAK